MKLSERLQSLADYFSPEEMFHSRALVLEAMELAKRYEDAPVRSVLYMNQAGGLVCYVSLPENMAGQRVRLVVEGGE